MLRRLSSRTVIADCMRDFMMRASLPQDIVEAKKRGLHCQYLTTNGVPLQQEWNSVEEELYNIRIFFNLGVRMMHLTYNWRNMIGDGCGEPADAGLSLFGRRVVEEMNRVGVIVDLAHSGWKTSLEAARLSKKPVVVSHSACAGLHHHVRCQPDEVIRAVADSGGYIGITCIPHFLGGTGDIRALLDHVDYAAKKFGVDHVAIGTDVIFGSRIGRKVGIVRPRARPKWGDVVTRQSWTTRPEMTTSMEWTNWPLFTVGLVQRGYPDDDIRKIIGGNMMRVVRAVLPAWMPAG
jgi:membrane dipeptidase